MFSLCGRNGSTHNTEKLGTFAEIALKNLNDFKTVKLRLRRDYEMETAYFVKGSQQVSPTTLLCQDGVSLGHPRKNKTEYFRTKSLGL